MPGAVSVPGVGGPASTQPTAQQRTLSFDQASHRGSELSQSFANVQLGNGAATTATVTIGNGPISLLPQGFLRGIMIDLSTSTAGVAGVANADYPFCLINLIRLHDTNGATMHEHNGYLNYLLNLFGGTVGETSDLSQWPDFSASATAPSCQWYLPVELDADGFGSLANQSAADTYKLDLVLESPTNAYVAAALPTTNPIFAIGIYVDYWTLPGATDMLGRPQAQEPNFHGVAQYTYQSTGNVNPTGQGTLKLGFTGNMYRLLIIVCRTTTGNFATGGARAAAQLPNPFTLRYDTRDLFISTPRDNRRYWFSELNVPSTTFLTGVLCYFWNYGKGRHVGGSGFSSWLPTLPATRFEVTGTFAGGTTDYLANTVSVAETNPALRGVSPSATGYAPPVAATVPGAQ